MHTISEQRDGGGHRRRPSARQSLQRLTLGVKSGLIFIRSRYPHMKVEISSLRLFLAPLAQEKYSPRDLFQAIKTNVLLHSKTDQERRRDGHFHSHSLPSSIRLCHYFCLLYSLSCLLTLSDSFFLLLLGRVTGGMATSLLFSTFESWMIAEHNRQVCRYRTTVDGIMARPIRHGPPAHFPLISYRPASFATHGVLPITSSPTFPTTLLSRAFQAIGCHRRSPLLPLVTASLPASPVFSPMAPPNVAGATTVSGTLEESHLIQLPSARSCSHTPLLCHHLPAVRPFVIAIVFLLLGDVAILKYWNENTAEGLPEEASKGECLNSLRPILRTPKVSVSQSGRRETSSVFRYLTVSAPAYTR